MTFRIKRGIRVRAGASVGALALAFLAGPALADLRAVLKAPDSLGSKGLAILSIQPVLLAHSQPGV